MSKSEPGQYGTHLAELIISRTISKQYCDGFIGDFQEMFSEIAARRGRIAARFWLLSQIFLSLPSMLKQYITRGKDMFHHNLKISLRTLKRHKGYTFINVIGLSLGLACTIIILLWINYERNFDHFHENLNRLHRVAFRTEGGNRIFRGDILPGQAAEYLKRQFPEIEEATSLGGVSIKLTTSGRHFSGSGYFVDPSFFTMFSFPIIAGERDKAFTGIRSIVLTNKFARRIFGDEPAVGKSVRLNDQSLFQVSGVIADIPETSTIQFEFLLDFQLAPEYMKMWDNKAVRAFVLLQPGADMTDVSEKIVDVYNIHNSGAFKNNFYLQPFSETHLHSLDGGGLINYVTTFSVLAVIILLMACINFTNLSTARSEIHSKEVGMKKIIGSGRGQLVVQFLVESILLAFISLILAVVIAQLCLPSLRALLGKSITMNLGPGLIGNLFLISLFTGVIAGAYPAFFLSSFHPLETLKGTAGPVRNRGVFLRKMLVIAQFSLTIIFLISMLIISNQLNFMKGKDLGFTKDHIVLLKMSGQARRRGPLVKAELLKHSNILHATSSQYNLNRWYSSTGISWEGKRDDAMFDVGFNWVDQDFLNTLDISMKQGRFFSEQIAGDRSAFVINEVLAGMMGLENPVGVRLTLSPGASFETKGVVIGVVKNFHTESLHREIRPFILRYAAQGNYLGLRIAPVLIPDTLAFVESKIAEMVPNHHFEYSFLDEDLDRQYQTEQLTGSLVQYINVLAIFVSCLGLLGLASFSVDRRVKEIGVRKVFGASLPAVMFMFIRDSLKPVLLSILIAWPLAYIITNRWLQQFAFRTKINPLIYLIASILALLVALFTVSIQSFKAGITNPVESLKHE